MKRVWGYTLFWFGIGMLMMFSASYPAAIEDGQPGTFYAVRQLVFAVAGLLEGHDAVGARFVAAQVLVGLYGGTDVVVDERENFVD